MQIKLSALALLFSFLPGISGGQTPNFYFGSDLSYVNEMEDCGAVFKENGQPKDVYEIFADHKTNAARFRLWHTPSWMDTLNVGKRYSDFNDVRRAMLRAKAAGMDVLLDFHLSDFWADPQRQWIPKAWEPVANNLPALKDSLYNYVFKTLADLNASNLLPEMVQIGNETNRGILLTPAVNDAGWVLDWPRNAELFKTAIKAVRDAETAAGKKIKVALHIAGPADAGWLMAGFWSNGVRDFDIIGLSYYWAWHKPTTIADAGNVIRKLKIDYPGKSIQIFETGYIWTLQANDGAANIISETHPTYAPPSPDAQKRWLVDLTQEVISAGGEGVFYWEPAWVSSPCWTPWGQGSHQEHAAFFDFSSNVLPGGGILWPEQPYSDLSVSPEIPGDDEFDFRIGADKDGFLLIYKGFPAGKQQLAQVFDSTGRLLAFKKFEIEPSGSGRFQWALPKLSPGIYFVSLNGGAVRRVLVR